MEIEKLEEAYILNEAYDLYIGGHVGEQTAVFRDKIDDVVSKGIKMGIIGNVKVRRKNYIYLTDNGYRELGIEPDFIDTNQKKLL